MRLPNQSAGVVRTATYRRGLQRGDVVPARAAFLRETGGVSPFVGGLAVFAIVGCKCPCCIEIAGHLVCCE